jgi:aminoglycoside phosphotransferase family enzyme/predicted kinase
MTAPSLNLDQQAATVAALLQSLREQPGARVELIETHISFVLLAGEHVYKLKKAVNLGFLDFTTLALRRHFCDEELRLNRRTAPGLYLDVVPVTGTEEQPAFDGDGPVIDWALKMRAFSQDGLWDRLAARGALGAAQVDALAESVCVLHDSADVAGKDHPFGQPEKVRAPMRDNFATLAPLCAQPEDRRRLAALDRWEADAYARLHDTFAERLRSGRVRECHGDLHLGNVTEVDGRTTMFDCLEFSAELRWTDVMSDVAFMAMDLHSHALPRLANRFVNACIERSGDAAGLRVLRYYMVHRALVRAKVAALRGVQMAAAQGAGHAAPGALHAVHHYLDVALACSHPAPPALMLTHGFSGSGKTVLTQSLLELSGAVRFRADVERKRLFGLPAAAHSDAELKARLYSASANEATQSRLRDSAEQALAGGFSVILDATFLDTAHRRQARSLAQRLGVCFVIIDFQASGRTLRDRVEQRTLRGDDASEADAAVLARQLADAMPMQPDELDDVFAFDAEQAIDEPRMAERWQPLLERLGLAPAAW